MKSAITISGKDILELETMSVAEMELILTTAKEMKNFVNFLKA